MRVVRGVNRAGGDVCHFTGAENAVFVSHPLFRASVDYIDDLLAMRMIMERVAVHRLHIGADEQEFVGGDDIRTTEPFVVGPGIGLAESVGDLDETARR